MSANYSTVQQTRVIIILITVIAVLSQQADPMHIEQYVSKLLNFLYIAVMWTLKSIFGNLIVKIGILCELWWKTAVSIGELKCFMESDDLSQYVISNALSKTLINTVPFTVYGF